ncbi:MAG TPA: tRNA (guanosine(37)-N1)-methyltransferase TrmD [Firmicutes bacterium]|nr:tRNA (guanosine(37)-N1)-methyltransferase TrmD [Bacillota bacterium]
MKISVLTIFPEMLEPLKHSILGRAIQNGIIELEIINIRDYSQSKHKNTDDYPFGGGAGMLMMPQPILDCMDSVCPSGEAYKICLSPRGRLFNSDIAQELAQKEQLILLCGHYEGIDQRVIDLMDEELSIGDYVLTGGEPAAIVVIDCISRFIGGVLGSAQSAHEDSFSDGLLEFPQYTRPAEIRGMRVPEVLLSGNHAKISQWRREQQLVITRRNRPDLLAKANLSKKDLAFLEDMDKQNAKD